MRSFRHQPSNRRQVYLNLTGSVEGQLRDAYAKRYDQKLDNQSSIAKKIGVGRSVVHRRLNGQQTNMTLESIADLVWALGYSITVDIFNPHERPTNARIVFSEFAKAPDDGATVSGSSLSPASFKVKDWAPLLGEMAHA